MDKRILVTGATGFIAHQLIFNLLEKGYRVRGTVRSLEKGEKLKQTLSNHTKRAIKLELAVADLESDKGWDDAMQGIDIVQHLASPFPLAAPKNPDDLIRPAKEGTLRVLRATQRAGIKRIVLTSSAASIAYGWGKDLPRVLTEEHWSNPDNKASCPPYQASKTLAEKAAWDFVESAGKGMELTTINPVGVFGPILSEQVNTSIGIIADIMSGKYPAVPDAGLQIVDVRDVSAAHIEAMENAETIGQRYILADEFWWFKDFASVLLEAYPEHKKQIPVKKMPSVLIKLLALFNGDMKSIAMELGVKRFASSDKVRKLLGRDLIPAKESILESARSLKKYGVI